MTYRNDLDAAHTRIAVLERENRALEDELERLRWPELAVPTVAIPMAMEPIRRASTSSPLAPIDLGYLLGAARIVIFLFIVLYVLVLDFAR